MAGDDLQPDAGLVVAPQQQQGPLLELLCDFVQGVALGCPVLLPLQHCSCTVLGQLLVLHRLLHINNNNNNNLQAFQLIVLARYLLGARYSCTLHDHSSTSCGMSMCRLVLRMRLHIAFYTLHHMWHATIGGLVDSQDHRMQHAPFTTQVRDCHCPKLCCVQALCLPAQFGYSLSIAAVHTAQTACSCLKLYLKYSNAAR